jgi:hypothetical protein
MNTKGNTMDKFEFCRAVGLVAYDLYSVEDGSNVCYGLMEMGVIDLEPTAENVNDAAQLVALNVLYH